MLFDLFVTATFLLWLNKRLEKNREIRKYHEEIDDFRYWKSREAMYRIVGNIKRLEKNGVTKINLRRCLLKHAPLRGVKIIGANLRQVKLQNAILGESKLEEAILDKANLEGEDFRDAKGIFENQLTKVKILYNAN